MRTKGYAIWLLPQGEVFKELSALIKKLSIEYGSPNFKPHVTLIGGIASSQNEIVEKTRRLASFIKQFDILVDGIGYSDYYFRTLFLGIKQAGDIMKAYEITKDVLNLQNTGKYMPHLSLMYGNFSEQSKKEIIKTQNLKNLKFSFLVDAIHLYETNGKVEDWKKLKEFKLITRQQLKF